MKPRFDLSTLPSSGPLLREWKQLTDAETRAIRFQDWEELRRVHDEKEALQEKLERYEPDVFIRTESLNSDFYFHYQAGNLGFIKFKPDWQELFPPDADPINSSTNRSTKEEEILSFYTDYHKRFVELRCDYASSLYEKASLRVTA